MHSLTLIFAAACIFAIAYRFYGLFLANKVMNLRAERETPAVTLADGKDYMKTNKFCCSATTSRPSPRPARCSARSSRRSSATCPARCGS